MVVTESGRHAQAGDPSYTTSLDSTYLNYLNKHFYPFFGTRQMNRISPTLVQDWATQAHKDGLSPRSVRKYHVLLSSIFVRAVKDRVLVYNPCDHTELPKIITRKARTLTPDEYLRLLAAMPAQFHLMVETLIETGLRWGELIALKPRHIDFLRRSITIEETIVEISKAHSPNRPALRRQALPERQRTQDLRHPPSLARRRRRTHRHQRHRARRPPVRHQGRHPDLPQHLPHPHVAARRQGVRHRRRRPRPAPRPRHLATGRRSRPQVRHGPHGPLPDPDHQKYLHTLPDTDQRNLDALNRVQTRQP